MSVLDDVHTARQIVGAVERGYGFAPGTIAGRARTPEVIEARFAAVHLIHSDTDLRGAHIGRLLGRHHTTIQNALRRPVDVDSVIALIQQQEGKLPWKRSTQKPSAASAVSPGPGGASAETAASTSPAPTTSDSSRCGASPSPTTQPDCEPQDRQAMTAAEKMARARKMGQRSHSRLKKGRAWTTDDLRRLRELADGGDHTRAMIAAALDRSATAVEARLRMLGLHSARSCYRCHGPMPRDTGTRICSTCRPADVQAHGPRGVGRWSCDVCKQTVGENNRDEGEPSKCRACVSANHQKFMRAMGSANRPAST